jgi:GNAT superfamily N-acetyltransferase
MEYYCRGAMETDWSDIDRAILGAFHGKGEHCGFYHRYHSRHSPPLENIRVIVEKDPRSGTEKVVGVAPLLHEQAHFGNNIISFSGLFDVSTLPAYQGKGLGMQLQRDVARFLNDKEYMVAYLSTGLWKFYGKTGWLNVMNQWAYRLPVPSGPSLPQVPDGWRIKPCSDLSESDWILLQSLYENFNRDNPVSWVRKDEYWSFYRTQSPEKLTHLYVLNHGDQLRGYIWLRIKQENELRLAQLTEYALGSPANRADDMEIILNCIVKCASDMNTSFVDLLLPDRFPLIQAAIARGAKDITGVLSGVMVRVQSWAQFLPIYIDWVMNTRFSANPGRDAIDLQDIAPMRLKLRFEDFTLENTGGTKTDLYVDTTGAKPVLMIATDSPRFEGDWMEISIPYLIGVGITVGNQLASEMADEWEDLWPDIPKSVLQVLDQVFAPLKILFYETDHF